MPTGDYGKVAVRSNAGEVEDVIAIPGHWDDDDIDRWLTSLGDDFDCVAVTLVQTLPGL